VPLSKHSSLFRGLLIFSLLDGCDFPIQALRALTPWHKSGGTLLETSSKVANLSANCTTIVRYVPKCTSTAAKENRGHVPPAFCLYVVLRNAQVTITQHFSFPTSISFLSLCFSLGLVLGSSFLSLRLPLCGKTQTKGWVYGKSFER
jgi:hypothetical protein